MKYILAKEMDNVLQKDNDLIFDNIEQAHTASIKLEMISGSHYYIMKVEGV